jgi:phospholipase/carboxylesterase
MSSLAYAERPSAGKPDGLLILHHGRGADEYDLLALADVLDPAQRLHVVTPRGPLTVSGWQGYHWYVVPRVGYPDHDTFHASYQTLAGFHDELWQRTGVGPADTVLGGFSMGTVMSYALGLGIDRPPVAGILGFSGFIPTVEGWAPEFPGRQRTRVFVDHGRQDQVISIDFARRAQTLLAEGGLDLEYLEFDGVHQINASHLPRVRVWLEQTFAGRKPAGPAE